jgi:ribosomal protein S18 acetylase RimI-like enzyme
MIFGRQDTVTDFQVRPAQADDAEGIAEVQVQGWRTGYAGLLPATFLAALDVRSKIRFWTAELARDQRRGSELVAERNGEVIGFIAVGPTRDADAPQDGTVGELAAIYVLAAVRGNGVGYALHQAGMDVLREQGFREATLWVLANNEPSIAFYRRQGWIDDHRSFTEKRDEVILVEARYRLPLS